MQQEPERTHGFAIVSEQNMKGKKLLDCWPPTLHEWHINYDMKDFKTWKTYEERGKKYP